MFDAASGSQVMIKNQIILVVTVYRNLTLSQSSTASVCFDQHNDGKRL